MASTVTELLRRRFGGKSLPYDAEIEYLQNSGAQYIDTGYVGNLNTRIYVTAMILSYRGFIAGSRGNNTNSITLYTSSNATQRFGDKSYALTTTVNKKWDIYIGKDKVSYDSIVGNLNATGDFTTPTNIYVMHAGTTTDGSTRVYSFKLYNGDTLLRDMIPVRVGTTGYMYDRVSGQLFGNVGTGDFILGNDK